MLVIKQTETLQELQGIIKLQQKNLKQNLSVREKQQEGFVTVEHDMQTLQLMNFHEKQIIAVDQQKIIGYALVMVNQVKDNIPVLIPMFDMFSQIIFEGKKLNEHNYYVMGQICIDKEYRGAGLFRRLYDAHRQFLGEKYRLCVTEVSSNNKRSLGAHKKYGFETIHTFRDETDDWQIILMDWEK